MYVDIIYNRLLFFI